MDRLPTVKPYLLSSQQIFQTYGAISYGVKHTWLFREHFLSLFLLSFLFYCFPLFLCTDHWWRLSYLSLLVFVTLHSNEYIFPFLLCFWLIFFSQQFVRPPQTTIFPFCVSCWGWFSSLSAVQYHEPLSIVLQALCLSDLISWIYLSLLLYNH